ncbi:hypothetical protein [Gracilibacillus kekensis]|uniref:Uncharacterized protein n=1 Tax=Gracilibacillus kekensis TaxID=1027249 RepID=A0A1M7QUK9_9BACI|nr:hypothetical protein [Gracilibacillus kekensis]SHN35538.1 hypothetical protein SAMN05216179_3611 [Gracilibacillus kekensis]
MLFVYILFGFFLGLNVLFYSYLKINKTNFLFIPPIIVFLLAILCTGYGLLSTDNGWEGMTYGIIGFGIVLSSIIGVALVPVLYKYNTNSLDKKIKRYTMIILGVCFILCFIFVWFPGLISF